MSETFRVGDEVQHILEDGRIMKPRFVITSFSYDGSLNGIGKKAFAITKLEEENLLVSIKRKLGAY